MNWAILAEMINIYFVISMILIGLVGVFIGYMAASIRLYRYLKKYYPEVDFTQHPKERKRILEEKEEKKMMKELEKNGKEIKSDENKQNKKK